MNQVDRYLAEIRQLLPRDTRDDVMEELRDALLSVIEQEQADQARSLTAVEVDGVLSRFGAPRVVAARYGATSYLVGPRMYPVFLFVAKALAVLIGGIALIRIGVVAFTAEAPVAAVAEVAVSALVMMVLLSAAAAIGLGRLERLPLPPLPWEMWIPRSSTPCDPARPGWGTRSTVPRRETSSALYWLTFWLIWWTGALPLGDWILWRWLPILPAQIVTDLTPYVVWTLVAAATTNAVALAWPRLARFHEATQLLTSCAMVALAIVAVSSVPLVLATNPTASAQQAARVTNIVLIVCLAGLVVVSAAYVAAIVKGWTRSTRGHHDGSLSARA